MGDPENVDEDRGGVELLAPTSRVQMVQARAMIDSSIATAKAYPRDEAASIRRLTALCTSDDAVAASCFYVLERGGKRIEGPSVRFTELLSACWKNLQVGARVVDVDLDAGRAMVEAVCHDLENNVLGRAELPVRLTSGKGATRKVYDDDMVGVALAAGMAKARRNAILQVVPFALLRSTLRQAREVAIGKAESLGDRRTAALTFLAKAGIVEARVLAKLGVKTVPEIMDEHLLFLRAEVEAIRAGEKEASKAFPPLVEGTETDRAKAVTEKLTNAKPAKTAAPAKQEAKPEPEKKAAPPAEKSAPAPVTAPAADLPGEDDL